MALLLPAWETNIHLRWDLKNNFCGIKKVSVSYEIEDFTINIKTATTSVLMELFQHAQFGNVCLNLLVTLFRVEFLSVDNLTVANLVWLGISVRY